ncbi:hypothetical protein PILCRDRAFT_109612 [Piloderma croceum F 1598]|uniref:Cytochrome P450 n=1 Tax=Piloderma croceum (strain F 1598) TaxID=765440 RepID=A0A0C3G729_PILCF|nr:hypothetical protein PILCRDRAFT_109612 [Piloderma croceum F 1598]
MKPDAMRKILVSDWIEYPRPLWMRQVWGTVTGYGLLTVTGNEHKQMRKAMNPAFSLANLMAQTDMYYNPIYSLMKILEHQIQTEPDPSTGEQMLLYEWMSKVTLDIICKTAFDYESDSLHNPYNELAQAYESMINLQSGTNMARMIAFLHIPGFAKLIKSGLFSVSGDFVISMSIYLG